MRAYVLIFVALCIFATRSSADPVPSSTANPELEGDNAPSIGLAVDAKEDNHEDISPFPVSTRKTINFKIPSKESLETDDLPWLVFVKGKESEIPKCGGSIIAKYWILAPGGCVCYDNNGPTWNPTIDRVATGNNKDYAKANVDYKIENVICHDNFGSPSIKDGSFNGWMYDNNIALIKLKEKTKWGSHLEPIPINVSPGSKLTERPAVVRIWGDIYSLGNSSLRRTEREIMSREDCMEYWNELYSIPFRQNLMCLKTQEPCRGISDSDATLQGVLIGIPSTEMIRCDENVVFYTNVTYHRNWISRYVKNINVQEIEPLKVVL